MILNRKKKSDDISQLVSWGHWFALFNILFSFIISSRYLFISDWPITLLGRFYAFINFIGHFSFIIFACYLLILFPLTFVIRSDRWMRIISAVFATIGLALLLIDSEVFSRFRLHLNFPVWELLVSPEENGLVQDWQILFIFIPLIFLFEMLFASWSWKKLRSLNKRNFAKSLALFFISCFLFSHLIHIWADAHFYRPITMQKANLPLSYPMTARHFLEKYGFLDGDAYKEKLIQQGNPAAMSVNYPLSHINFDQRANNYNLLLIVVDGINANRLATDMPDLTRFANDNIQFSNHYSSANRKDLGLFSLFYGISPNYYDGILSGRIPSALTESLAEKGYNFGLFSADGFALPVYRQALLSNFSLPVASNYTNHEITQQWKKWFDNQAAMTVPWFSYINYQTVDQINNKENGTQFIKRYKNSALNVDQQINQIIEQLSQKGQMDNTVIVITASHGVELNDDNSSSWGAGQNYSQYQLKVPLIIHWPTIKQVQDTTKITSHVDIMRTLMQHLLGAKTSAENYSQGEDLFAEQRRFSWISAGDTSQLVIITPERTVILKPNSHYQIYDEHYHLLKDEKINLATYLQVLTEMRRFIAN